MKNFEDIYTEIINNNYDMVKDYKKVQSKDNKYGFYSNLVVAIAIIIVIFIIFKTGFVFLALFSIPFIIIIKILVKFILEACFGVLGEKEKVNYNYKNNIMNQLINNIYENSEYFPQKEMPRYIYDESNFERIKYENCFMDHKYYSEDYIEGNMENNGFQIAEIKTQDTYKDKDGDEHTITIFNGLFAKIDLENKTDINMKIVSANYEFGEDKVKLDYPLFEKYFNVSSSDKDRVMQILTLDILDYLVQLRDKIKMDFDIAIDNDKMFIRIHSQELFDLNDYNKDIFDKKVLYKHYMVLSTIKDLIHNFTKII